MAETKRGKLIVIEGTDCSGKATQTQMLVERLNSSGLETIKMGFPVYSSPTGNIVGNPYLGKHPRELSNPNFDFSKLPYFGSWFGNDPSKVNPLVASFYYAADRKAHQPEMVEKLNSGNNIVCDRYVESNMGHQGGKIRDPKKREKFFRKLEILEYELSEMPRPDQVIFLYMPYQRGIQLKEGREGVADLHEANPDHLRQAEGAYLQLAELYSWTKVECDPNPSTKMPRTPKDIGQEVFRKVYEFIKK